MPQEALSRICVLKHIAPVACRAAATATLGIGQHIQLVKGREVLKGFLRRAASSRSRLSPIRPHLFSFEVCGAAIHNGEQARDGLCEFRNKVDDLHHNRRDSCQQTAESRAQLVLHRHACGSQPIKRTRKPRAIARGFAELVCVLQAFLERLRNAFDDASDNAIERNALQRGHEVADGIVCFLSRVPNIFYPACRLLRAVPCLAYLVRVCGDGFKAFSRRFEVRKVNGCDVLEIGLHYDKRLRILCGVISNFPHEISNTRQTAKPLAESSQLFRVYVFDRGRELSEISRGRAKIQPADRYFLQFGKCFLQTVNTRNGTCSIALNRKFNSAESRIWQSRPPHFS